MVVPSFRRTVQVPEISSISDIQLANPSIRMDAKKIFFMGEDLTIKAKITILYQNARRIGLFFLESFLWEKE
jgi:hypothetical protein